jgi:hypothetical protein
MRKIPIRTYADGDISSAYWCERPDLFAAIAGGKNAEERAQLVLKWFIVCALIFW